MKAKNPNIDICEGDNYPINAKEQGATFERFKDLMNYMRYHQLIKKVKYKIEIEYYPEVKEEGEGK